VVVVCIGLDGVVSGIIVVDCLSSVCVGGVDVGGIV